MSAILVFKNKPSMPPWDLRGKSTFRIGRHPENDFILQESWISRRHAMIQQESNQHYHIIDLGSANGTFVNGSRIVTPTPMHTGDIIALGKTELIFNHQSAPKLNHTSLQNLGDETIAFVNKKLVTILVCDIHRYTELSEAVGNEPISKLLLDWNKKATQIIRKYDGQVDKFIGDAVLAFWLQDDKDHLEKVLSAAMDINQITAILGEKLHFPWPLTTGAAINSGMIMLGNLGADGSRDFTMVGDAVNVAFRLESQTEAHTKEVILGQSTYEQLRQHHDIFTPQTFVLKGKNDKVQGYTTTFIKLATALKM
ncbi:MAG: adenylate/guanylate cyclase domain-containing protein [Proteobacteria bacterium]|nr:adenylate/guanylate cyclase domain-containing protein [Pseudomonadota bacterium]MBU1641251.1 adenylate/guanylate cyclase domain-containing protein [Pseudomonadota bacterium]